MTLRGMLQIGGLIAAGAALFILGRSYQDTRADSTPSSTNESTAVPNVTGPGRVDPPVASSQPAEAAPAVTTPVQPELSGTYVSNNRLGLMPVRIEFNGPRNCIVYTNGVDYAGSAVGPGASGLGPGGSSEGLCQRAEGGMEFSSTGFGGETMYFRAVDANTFSYQRRGRTIYLRR